MYVRLYSLLWPIGFKTEILGSWGSNPARLMGHEHFVVNVRNQDLCVANIVFFFFSKQVYERLPTVVNYAFV